MRIFLTTTIASLALMTGAAMAQDAPSIDKARVDEAIAAGFARAPDDWKPRLTPDETMEQCNASRNNPPDNVFEEIRKRAEASIKYPDDGVLMGDWKKGEALAQSGYGMRFTDYPAARENGGNCYACHQLTRTEVSYGTLGPSLLGYGKLRDFSDEAVKAAYEKLYNPHAAFPCSMMPRFGVNAVLTIDQIKDIVALLMDRESPVNE